MGGSKSYDTVNWEKPGMHGDKGEQGSHKVGGQFEGFEEFSQSVRAMMAFKEVVGRPGIQRSWGL